MRVRPEKPRRDYLEMDVTRYSNKAVVLFVSNRDGKGWWSLHFSGLNRGFIERREYDKATRYSRDSRRVDRLAVDFEQTCTDRSHTGILKGVVRYNSEVPAQIEESLK